jgi:hypothetical protein
MEMPPSPCIGVTDLMPGVSGTALARAVRAAAICLVTHRFRVCRGRGRAGRPATACKPFRRNDLAAAIADLAPSSDTLTLPLFNGGQRLALQKC